MASDMHTQIGLLTAKDAPYELVEVEVRGHMCRAFKQAPDTLRALYETARSEVEFFIYLDERLDFETSWQKACTLANHMVEDYGIEKGDRVAISMRNYPEWALSFMAITSIGGIACALNSLWQADEIDYALQDAQPKLLIVDEDRLRQVSSCKNIPADLKIIGARCTGPTPENLQAITRSWEDVMSGTQCDTMVSVDLGPDDDATMLYTSGSTGHPKGAVSSHRNVISALLSWELDAYAAVGSGLFDMPDESQQPAALLGVPLFHVSGAHAVFLSSFRAQRRVIAMHKWDPAEAARLIESERVTQFVAPAAMTGDLVNYARDNQRDLSSLALVGGGGAARAPEQVARIKQHLSTRPNTGWGMTETNAIGTNIAGDDYLERPESSGRCSAVLDMRIVDEEGCALPAGQRGELQVRGTSVIRGYWNRPDANAETFDGPWLRTGDVAYFDELGFVFIVDRIKDLVIRGGENIGCGAVEAAFLEHPDIIEASVYGLPDERLGEELGATLYATNPVDENQLRAFLSEKLARFEVPRYIYVQNQTLPRIASGKVLKRQLRIEAQQRLDLG